MNREEVIARIKEHMVIHKSEEPRAIHITEALEMAIKALEQKPCEDIMTIHTQGLDEEIRCTMCTNSMKSDRGCDGGCMIDKDMYEKVMDIIRNRIVSSTTPTRKKGEWVKFGQSFVNPNKFLCYSCSECGSGAGKVKTKFCPNCGAEMESEE